MLIRKGVGVSPGYAIAEALILSNEDYVIPKRVVGKNEIKTEISRLQNASLESVAYLQSQLERISKRIGDSAVRVIESHITMLRDEHLKTEIVNCISNDGYSAEYAINNVMQKKINMLTKWGDGFFAQRVQQDLQDIARLLLRNLIGGQTEELSTLKKSCIIVAHDLGPSQTIALDKSKIAGILTDKGGRTSHSAIIASSLGIPAIVGLETITAELNNGDTVILDGTTGTVIVNPNEETIKRYTAMERNFLITEQKLAKELKHLPAKTKDGEEIEILANIETPDDIKSALEHGAEGIGLYRTEFLYLTNNFNPSEDEQVQLYHKAANLVGDRKLVIRTLDIGADKMPIEGLPAEPNPFLGTRAIRLCFQYMDIFKTQLRAIFKVSSLGNVMLLFPMVSTVEEVLKLKEILDEVKRKLKAGGETFNEKMPIGIMIEVPSAALTADILADHVDFFSIGTNDLIAYSMAVDRVNERVANLYQPAHPAILRMLKLVIDAGKRKKKHVSLCGEMSSDIMYTILLLGMGLRSFSVVPPVIPEIKKVIRSVSIAEAEAVAQKALALESSRKTMEFLREQTRTYVPEVFH